MTRTIRAVLLVGIACLFFGCSPKTSEVPSTTGTTYTNVEFRAALADTVMFALLPDQGYSQVSSAFLKSYYAAFRADLFSKGIAGWEGRFDCNKFATAYASGAQMQFYRETFHSRIPAQALAIGEVWYLPAWANGGAHAINVAVTERGVLFIEPQTGNEVILTNAERRSIYYCRF